MRSLNPGLLEFPGPGLMDIQLLILLTSQDRDAILKTNYITTGERSKDLKDFPVLPVRGVEVDLLQPKVIKCEEDCDEQI